MATPGGTQNPALLGCWIVKPTAASDLWRLCNDSRTPRAPAIAKPLHLFHLQQALARVVMATQTPTEKTLAQGRGVVARFSTTPEEQLRLAGLYLRHFSSSTPAGPLRLIGPNGQAEEVPAELYSVLREVLQHLKDGQGISLIPNDTLLTTQQASQLLNISRPYLYKLIDAGEIPFEQVGSHRRLRLCDVEGLRERRRAESRKALDAIAALEDDNCDYFDSYGETTRE